MKSANLFVHLYDFMRCNDMRNSFGKMLLVAMVAALCLEEDAAAQLQTKKFRLSEFTCTNMLVVLTGNEINDAMYREGVKKTWNISPYEFCNMETFEQEKRDTAKFFLLISESTPRQEEGAGIFTLGVFQGSEKKHLCKLSSIPFCPVTDPDGKEYVFLPLLLRALQNDINVIMKKELNPGNMVRVRSGKKQWGQKILLDENDLAFKPEASEMSVYEDGGILILSGEEMEHQVMTAPDDVLVAYTVTPAEGTKRGFCYKMIFDAADGELYFFSRHLLSEKRGGGFLKSDLDELLSHKK